MNDEKEDDSPWDDDDGARTLATASPSFDSNVPSPITVPPPPVPAAPRAPAVTAAPPEPAPPRPAPVAAAPKPDQAGPRGSVGAVRPLGAAAAKMTPKATLVGLNPADFMKSLPRVGATPKVPTAPAPFSSPPPPAPAPRGSDAGADEDDGPTMLGGAQPPPISTRNVDKNAETMAADRDDERLPRRLPSRPGLDSGPLPDLSSPEDADETTRAVPREDLGHTPEPPHRPEPPHTPEPPPASPRAGAPRHEPRERKQSASVIVGQGAVGDEATLAIGPGTFDPALAAASAASLGPPLPPQPSPANPLAQTAFAAGPPPYVGPFPDPLLPSSSPMFPGQAPAPPPSWQGPASHPYPQGQPYPAPGQASVGPGFGPSAPMMQQPGTAPAPWLAQHPPGVPPWAVPSSNVAPLAPQAPQVPASGGGFQITSQIMLLAGVGFVCFAIFVVGVVLFITSKG